MRSGLTKNPLPRDFCVVIITTAGIARSIMSGSGGAAAASWAFAMASGDEGGSDPDGCAPGAGGGESTGGGPALAGGRPTAWITGGETGWRFTFHAPTSIVDSAITTDATMLIRDDSGVSSDPSGACGGGACAQFGWYPHRHSVNFLGTRRSHAGHTQLKPAEERSVMNGISAVLRIGSTQAPIQSKERRQQGGVLLVECHAAAAVGLARRRRRTGRGSTAQVNDFSRRRKADASAARADGGAKVDVFRVHLIALVEEAHRVGVGAAHEQTRAADPVG